MDNLLGELDGEEEDDNLGDINDARMAQNRQSAIIEDESKMAFNKEEEIDMKYNVKTNTAASEKKRNINDISAGT